MNLSKFITVIKVFKIRLVLNQLYCGLKNQIMFLKNSERKRSIYEIYNSYQNLQNPSGCKQITPTLLRSQILQNVPALLQIS